MEDHGNGRGATDKDAANAGPQQNASGRHGTGGHEKSHDEAAHAIATSFVFGVQQDAPAVATPGSPGWVIEQHGGGVFAEHASWLTAADLERLLGDTLRRFAYVVDLQAQSAAERVNEVLAIAGEDVVALVNEQHRFRDAVVNRRDILEALGGEARRDDSGEE